MAVTEKGAPKVVSLERSLPQQEAEIRALRGALRIETMLAEALACRSRGLIRTVEILSRRALDEARDVEDARARLQTLAWRMRGALAVGEIAPAGGAESMAQVAARTLEPFETGEGPRMVWSGPAVVLSHEAARLMGLTLFELASRSLRHGALALAEGRAAVAWRRRPDGALRLNWREYGAAPDSEGLRRGAGSVLLPLLTERFGGRLRVRVTPFGLDASLVVPPRDLIAPVIPLAVSGQPPVDPGSDPGSGSGAGRSRA